jgi:cytochrome c-type biogenesis protein CcsB
MSGLRRLVHVLASLRLAVVTMAALGVACIAATFYESAHGTAATQRLFYRSPWFTLLLAVLAASILFSALERYPWNRHHVGFVLAHAGILLLLAGSVVSLHAGLDGRLTLVEGETSAQLGVGGETLHLGLPDGTHAVVPVDFGRRAPQPGTRVAMPGAAAAIVVEEYEPNASLGDVWAEAMPGQSGVPALQFTLSGHGGQPLSGWLMAGDPGPAHVEIGPILFSLQAATSEDEARSMLEPQAGVNQVAFVAGPGDALRYAISSRKGRPATGALGVGEAVRTPWMDLSVSVGRFLRQAVRQRVVTRHAGDVKEEDRSPAVRVRVETPAGTATEWLAFGAAETIDLGGAKAHVGYGPAESELPFRVTLLDFNSETYPGSRMAATYESRVRVEDPQDGSFERTISMNRPLHHRGYTLFQASYIDGEPQTSILSVSRAPGLPLVYLGSALLGVGALWMSFFKRWVARRQGRSALARLQPTAVSTAVLLAMALSASPARADDGLAALREVAVQDGGRLKPLDTFARESARRITGAKPFTGGETVKGLDAVEWLVGMLAEPARWQSEPIVRVAHADLRAAVGLPAGRDRFSYAQLTAHEGLAAQIASVRDKLARDEALDAVEAEVASLYETLALMRGLLDGSAIRIVPVQDASAAWLSIADLAPGAEGGSLATLRDRVGAVVAAHGRGQDAAAASAALRDELRALGGAHYADAATLAREVGYNRLKPFRMAWMLYLTAFLLLLASFPLASRRLGWAGLGLAALGLASNTHGLVLRTVISGRAPVTNMYETVVFVAWGAVLLALVFEALYRGRVAATCASGLAVVALILADNVPILDGSIAPLVPVLRDNMWLTLHVLTITLGYAAFFLAMGLGHLNLGLFVLAPGRTAQLKSLSLFLYRSLQVGTFFLAIGTLLGGVWASYSWGRFWGWDPKETWALIALLGYLAVLHGRLIGWFKDFGLAVGAIAGFLLVLMAWYGVNYVLGTGLHAYGFGSGGAGWMLAFAVAEMVVIVLALARRAQLAPLPSPAREPRAVAVP